MGVILELGDMEGFLGQEELEGRKARAAEICRGLYRREDPGQVLGWRTSEGSAVQLDEIRKKAEEIRKEAQVFVLVGVGGSNQAARAVIEAMKGRPGPEVLYLGNTLSPYSVYEVLKAMEGKSVYINVIAKNFETLEPGSHFRILRQWMGKRYSPKEMAKRIVVTGTAGSRLEGIARREGYLFLQFPVAVGGRYSAFTPVALFPLAVAGLDIGAYLEGMESARGECQNRPEASPAVIYASVRNLLYGKGYDIEVMASFEPRFGFLEKWWMQLFGEGEGKEKKGIFPAAAIYSEDLHSLGQYMQDGRRNLIETFLTVQDGGASLPIEPCPGYGDGFDYLDCMDFGRMNKVAEAATLNAHRQGGVPCLRFQVDEISEQAFGELFYYFMVSCAVSGELMGVDPFGQEGVEAYKRSMFAMLRHNVEED